MHCDVGDEFCHPQTVLWAAGIAKSAMKAYGKEALLHEDLTVHDGRDLVEQHVNGLKCNHILELRDVFNCPWETIKVHGDHSASLLSHVDAVHAHARNTY